MSQNKIKNKRKLSFHINKFIIHYVKEEEYKILNKTKSKDEKIKEFFDIYRFLLNVSDVIFGSNQFYRTVMIVIHKRRKTAIKFNSIFSLLIYNNFIYYKC